VPENALERAVLEAIGPGVVHIDDLVAASGLGVREVSQTLAHMEIKGMVRHIGQMRWASRR
jgi:predicted Rossmann fold nucleotide-binding protein DprA/Smf involved in DNA uptake